MSPVRRDTIVLLIRRVQFFLVCTDPAGDFVLSTGVTACFYNSVVVILMFCDSTTRKQHNKLGKKTIITHATLCGYVRNVRVSIFIPKWSLYLGTNPRVQGRQKQEIAFSSRNPNYC